MAIPLSILLVDDEPIIIKSVARFLQLHNYSTTTCENGLDALSLANQKFYDVVIADLDLPMMNGMDLLRRIRSIHPASRLIITSGTTPLDERWGPHPDEAITVLPKPFDLDLLIEAINKPVSPLEETRV